MADINISDVTNVGGTGTFDVLMDAINTRIQLQYTENRITGTDYANVYLGSIQAALAQSMQFNLQQQLVEAQIAEALAGTVRAQDQLTDSLLTTEKQRILLDEEKSTSDAQQLILGKDLLLKVEQLKVMYTDRVAKDKEASKLGLDNTMQQSEESRKADSGFTYTPKYTEV